ncbi:MAG: MauE/DoxX family redox-associated membrane protein [Desulfovibrionaceae bacterium]
MRKLRHAALALRIVLAGVFLYASIDKILHPADFAAIIKDYRVLPDVLINITAIILPWLELVLGVLLLTGRWLEGSLLLANALLVTFWSTLVFNYSRGLDVSCGCFSTQTSESPNMVWYMVRDGFFVLVGLLAGAIHIYQRKRNLV